MRHSSSPSDPGGGVPPRHPMRLALPLLGALSVTIACSDRTPTAPPITPTEIAEANAAVHGPPPPSRSDEPLAIEDLLGDPLFHAEVASVADADLATLLQDAVQALQADQLSRARTLLGKAVSTADALGDNASTDPEVLLAWSVIERYLDEADLI